VWHDTIKDFVLANCHIFTGQDEFSHNHLKCHKDFCKIIEDTLSIFVLESIGVPFSAFHEACLEAYRLPSNAECIARDVIGILKQATDFRYFASKMYAYNVMLDREAAASFLVKGGKNNQAFFMTEGAVIQEAKIVDQETSVATAQVNEIERELGIPESTPVEILSQVKPAPVKAREPAPAPAPQQARPTTPESAKILPGSPIKKLTEKEKDEMKKKFLRERAQLNSTMDQDELAKRKEALMKRRQEIVAAKRSECKEQIQISSEKMKKAPKVVPAPEADAMDVLREALAGRVRTIIQQRA
jgi:hypothetical protein